jgi:hypothetical protein
MINHSSHSTAWYTCEQILKQPKSVWIRIAPRPCTRSNPLTCKNQENIVTDIMRVVVAPAKSNL